MKAIFLLVLLLLSGCSGTPFSPSSDEPPGVWNGPPLVVGDTWQESGPLGNFTYRIQAPVEIPYFTGNLTTIPLAAPGRTLFLDARTGLLLGVSINRQPEDFWHEGPGGWMGKPVQGTAFLAYTFFSLANRQVQAPLDFDFAIAPYTAEPSGESLSVRLRGDTEGRPNRVTIGHFQKVSDTEWKVTVATQPWTFRRSSEGSGQTLTFDPTLPDSMERIQEILSGEAVDEIQSSYGKWTFTQKTALRLAEASPQWPLHGPYTVLHATYSISATSPITTNESWSFELQANGDSAGTRFMVSRLNLLGDMASQSVSAFQATNPRHPCVGTNLPRPRTDPVMLSVQMAAAGYRVLQVSADLVERQSREPPGVNLAYEGQPIPLKCDWFLEAYGDTGNTTLSAQPPNTRGPLLHLIGWATGDGIVAPVG